MKISNKKLSAFLKSKMPKGAGFTDKIKIGYRPYICPFGELLECLPQNSSVFDIGCGNGMFLSLVAKFKNPRYLGGIEISENLIANASSILKDSNRKLPIYLNVFDGETIPDEICNFDHISLIDVLHHVPDNNQINFLKNIHEKMSIGSKLILKDINAENIILSKFNKIHDFLLSGNAGHELRLTDVKNELIKMDFKILLIARKRILFYPHYAVICEKK